MDIFEIVAIGINHKTTPFQAREKIYSGENDSVQWRNKIYRKLNGHGFTEKVIVSTCNRIEVYGITGNSTEAEKNLRKLFPGENAYFLKDEDAVKHLFEVSSGIDSEIIGEAEILGQVKKAYLEASRKKQAGPVLHELFKRAIYTGKKSREKTLIGSGFQSTGQAVFTLIKGKTADIAKSKILIIGAGETAGRVAKHISHYAKVVIANRTYVHSVKLAKSVGGKAIPFARVNNELKSAAAVITATTSFKKIISGEKTGRALKGRKKPIILIDLSVPRNIDDDVVNIENVFLYTLGDVNSLVIKNSKARKKEISKVKMITETETENFRRWLLRRETVPVMSGLSKRMTRLHRTELAKSLAKLNHLHLSERDKEVISALTMRVMTKLLATPINKLKIMADSGKAAGQLQTVKELFELE